MNATMRTFLRMSKEAKLFCVGILGIVYAIYIYAAHFQYMNKGNEININEEIAKNNNDYPSENIYEEFCKVDINAGLGTFHVSDNSTSRRNRAKESGTYYIVQLEDNSVMLLKVAGAKYLTQLDTITQETDIESGKRSGTTITAEGRVTKIEPGSVFKEYEEALKKYGIDKGQYGVRVRYACMDVSYNTKGLWAKFFIGIFIGVACLFGNAILYLINKKAKASDPEYIKENEVPTIREYEPVEFDPSHVVDDESPKKISFSGRNLIK